MKLLSKLIVICLFAALALPRITLAQDGGPAPFKKEEIEQLVAPIALYPDSLVAQILMASTYPLEVVSAARWVKANPNVKDKALEDAMQQQPWDPSVKSLTAFPQVLAMMNEKLEMTQALGDAFLAQQKDVLDAIQRLRGRAEQAGNLKSSQEQNVTTVKEGGETVIKIEPANPQVVYVPTYQPAVYGPWPYPAYPPYYYYPPGYVPGAMLFSFAVGVAVGNALWGNCNWGGGSVYINQSTYNNYNRTNIKNGDWQHRPEHRKGAEYRDRGSRERFGNQRPGVDTRESFRGRAEQGRQDIGRGGADSFKGPAGGVASRPAGPGSPQGGFGERGPGQGGVGDRGPGQGGMGNRGPSQGGFGDRGGAGNRGGAFQGVGNGAQTRDFSSRGAASRGSAGARGGGAPRGGSAPRGGGGRRGR